MISPELRTLIEQAVAAQQAAGLAIPSPHPDGDAAAWAASIADARAQWDGMLLTVAAGAQIPEIPVREVRDVWIHVGGGAIAARCYLPAMPPPHAAVAFFHGGGFWMGGGQAANVLGDPICRLIAARVGAVVLNVDYRLAPEHKYPTAVDDGYAAAEWLYDHASELEVDRDRIALLGISSGANVAAVTARRAREHGGPPIRYLALLSPALDLTGDPDSLHQPEVSDGLEAVMHDLVDLYLSPEDDPHDPDISPGLDSDFTGLPPTFVVTGEHDVLRPQGEAYAERLKAAGVDATAKRYPMSHSIALPETLAAYTGDVIAALAQALAPSV